MQNVAKTYVGVDVSKEHLDVYLYPQNKKLRVENSKSGLRKLNAKLNKLDVAKVMLEASGGYEHLAIVSLHERYPVYRANPKRIRSFRDAKGTKAKNDPIDARIIAEFAANDCSKNLPQVNIKDIHLKRLFHRKQALKTVTSSEKMRLEKEIDLEIRREIVSHIKNLEKRIKKYDEKINEIIKADKELSEKKTILESMPGIGNETAQGIIAALPEAGNTDSPQLSSLTGLAPQTNESGQFVGRARINNGRRLPRRLLYMAALTAVRFNPRLKEFYERLRKKGKPYKVAIVAVMRKMLTILNVMLNKNEMWKLKPEVNSF